MAFTSIEIIALVLLVLVVIKMVFLLISPKSWANFAKGIWKNKIVFKLVCLALAAVVFYYLIQVFTVVQIFAVAAFVALLLAIGLADPIKRIIPIYEKQIKSGTLWKDNWLYTLIWLALMVWVVIELFF